MIILIIIGALRWGWRRLGGGGGGAGRRAQTGKQVSTNIMMASVMMKMIMMKRRKNQKKNATTSLIWTIYRDPNAPYARVKWDHNLSSFAPMQFKETMITHLDIPSR